MSTTLEQRSLFSSETFTLDYNGVRIHRQTLNQDVQWLLPFEEIPLSRFAYRAPNRNAVFAGMILVAPTCALLYGTSGQPLETPTGEYYLSAACFALAVISAALVVWFTRHDIVGLAVPGKGIFLKARRPSRAAVEAFLQELQARRRVYLREMYLDQPAAGSSQEKLGRLVWLKNMGALADDEFEARRRELGSERPAGAGKMGF